MEPQDGKKQESKMAAAGAPHRPAEAKKHPPFERAGELICGSFIV